MPETFCFCFCVLLQGEAIWELRSTEIASESDWFSFCFRCAREVEFVDSPSESMIILIFSNLTFCAHTSHAPFTGDIGGDSWAGASLRRRECSCW